MARDSRRSGSRPSTRIERDTSGTPRAKKPAPAAARAVPDPRGQSTRRAAKTEAPKPAPGHPAAETGSAAAPLAPMDYVTGWIVIVGGPGTGHAVEVRHGAHTLGRDADQEISIDFGDPDIAPKAHARLIYDDRANRFALAAGDSRVIVYVDDEPLLESRHLVGGEIISIGATRMMFVAFCDDGFSWRRDGAGT